MKEALTKLITNIANLIKVKTLVTIAVMAIFVVLALKGTITGENVMYITTAVISFYFGTVSEKKEETK